MRKAISSITALVLSFVLCINPARAQVVSEQETDAIKQDISRLYSTTAKKVSVKLRNGTRLKGYISAVESDTFSLRVDGNRTDIRYADVASVSRSGLSSNQKTALLVGVGAAVVVLAVVFGRKKDNDGGFRNPCLLC